MNGKYYKYIKDKIYKHRLLLFFGLLNLITQVVFIIYSDIEFLSTKWFVDDSFYYLQTAWNFKSTYQFTFDGSNITYGFQPLWMIISVLISFLSPNKIFYFKSILLFSGFLYFICGLLIYLIFSRTSEFKLKYLPSMIWFLNPDLVHTFNSGKENILALLLLLLIIYFLFEAKNSNSNFALIALGILNALLILARVNTIIFVLIILFLLFFNKNFLRQERNQIFLFIVPLVIVLLPWAIYSYWTFNTVFPTSGTVKLYGALSSWLIWFSNVFKIKDFQWLKGIISQFEWKLLENKVMISPPMINDLIQYTLKFLPINIFGLGVYGLIKKSIYPYKYLLEIFYYLVLITPLVLVLIKPTKFSSFKEIITSIFNKIKGNPLTLLIIYSFVNIILSFILLSKWMLYSNWYSFAEMLSILFLFGIIINVLFQKVKLINRLFNKKFLVVLSILLTVNFLWQMYPKVYEEDSSFNSQAWEARNWMLNNLNKSEFIGCWSSGILGYWMEGYKINNLDGLINSPDYVRKIIPNFILFQNELTNQNLIWNYLKKNKIKYIADAWFNEGNYSNYFHWAVPEKNYEIIYIGSKLINWNEPQGPRRYCVIKLKY